MRGMDFRAHLLSALVWVRCVGSFAGNQSAVCGTVCVSGGKVRSTFVGLFPRRVRRVVESG